MAPTGRVAVVCGKGNNGGDGIVAARLLREAGREVDVLCVWPPPWMTKDAKAMLKKLPGAGCEAFERERLQGAAVIVDALLGTGFKGEPRDPLDKVIAAINARARQGRRRRRPERRQRLHRRGGGRGGQGRGDRDVPPRQARACGSTPARRTPARSTSSTSGSPAVRRARRAAA